MAAARRMVLQGGVFAALLVVSQLVSSASALSDEKDSQRRKCIAKLQEEYRKVLNPLVVGKHAHLVDMVWHGNLGDSFIEHGERLYLQETGNPVRVFCTMKECNYDAIWEELRRYPNDSVILVNGGGNFGDIYRFYERAHLEIVQKFMDFPIVFLPQSVFYDYQENAERDAEEFAKHPNTLVLARDFKSHKYLKKYFRRTPARLCPDGAFMIGALETTECTPQADVFFLKRRDSESRGDLGTFSMELSFLESKKVSYVVADWPCGIKSNIGREGSLNRSKLAFEQGRQCLCNGGRVLVTDRLHGTIMATLLGIPYVYLDNSYGKITGYRETFFANKRECRDSNLRARRANSWSEAVRLAHVLLQELQNYGGELGSD